MEDLDAYTGLSLRGGFLLKFVRSVSAPMTDALNRPALARTTIIGLTLVVELSARLPQEEISVTLYHEILEAAAIAALHPPTAVCELNEAGFESAAKQMHANLGAAAPDTINRMLELFGF